MTGRGLPGVGASPAHRRLLGRFLVTLAAALAAVVTGGIAVSPAGPGVAGRAAAAPTGAPQERASACAGALWGSCDTRATTDGYQYRYHNGLVEREPLGPDGQPGTRRAGCGQNCPDDPAAVCELYELVGPDPMMTPEERAAFDATLEDCDNVLIPDANAVPIAAIQDQLADYLREELLPKPTIVIAPAGRSFANLATILYAPVPDTFTFNVDEPVIATISATPHYHWDFGDGAVGPDAPGRPYDSAISPREHPDAYVSHRYPRPGAFQVALTVTWNGTFTLPGVAQAFPLEAVNLATAQPLVINEAAGVLVHND